MNAVDWDSPLWGVKGHNTHQATTDDLGDHKRHTDETEEP